MVSFRKASSIADCTNVFANVDRSVTVWMKKIYHLDFSFLFSELTGFNFVSISNGLIESWIGLITGFGWGMDVVRLETVGAFNLEKIVEMNVNMKEDFTWQNQYLCRFVHSWNLVEWEYCLMNVVHDYYLIFHLDSVAFERLD